VKITEHCIALKRETEKVKLEVSERERERERRERGERVPSDPKIHVATLSCSVRSHAYTLARTHSLLLTPYFDRHRLLVQSFPTKEHWTAGRRHDDGELPNAVKSYTSHPTQIQTNRRN
jgi:hypothetical protein